MTTENELNKELPISVEELQQKKRFLESINTEIWTTIEITPEIREILWNYKEDQIMTRSLEVLGDNLFKIKFVFPYYDIVKKGMPNDHVSIVQMQLALVQWLFTAIWFAIKQNGVNSPMSYETYLLNRGNVLYRRDERTMRKKLKFNEECYLIFKLHPVIKKWTKIYSIVAEIVKDKDTFLDGKVECVLQDEYLFDEREKENCKETKKNEEILPNTMAGNVLTRFEANKNIKDIITITDGWETKNDITDKKDTE